METFSGISYLKIDIANQFGFGLDKQVWTDRLLWTASHNHELEDLIPQAEEPMMMAKAVMAYRQVMRGEPTGHNTYLDATASGLQIMACLSGCYETAKKVNLVNTGKREDAYRYVVIEMNKLLKLEEYVDRALIKKPVMTHYYCKTEQETLSKARREAFYLTLDNCFEGAEQVMKVIQSFWNPKALEHCWTLPDKHQAVCKVTKMVNARIQVDELDNTTYTYRFENNESSIISSSLAPNIIHSIDGYVVREMILRAKLRGFELAHIHDSFCALPKYMNIVRQLYKDILCEIANSNLLSNILSEISGTNVYIEKSSKNLSHYIKDAEYHLS